MRRSSTVVITTKNRKEDLRKAVESCLNQTVAPEVLVVDDGSDDGTAAMIETDFPAVRLVYEPVSSGYITRRNQGARLATGEIVFSIDDDAIFSTPRVVEQTLEAFDDPRIGAVAIPFVNVKQDDIVQQRSPGEGVYVTDRYIGTAHAIRRDLFLELGGYREAFVHQGEEGDYCLRMLDAGYVVRLGRSDVIHHFESPKRNWKRMAYYGRRNDVLFTIWNVPMPALLVHLPATTIKGLVFALKRGYRGRMVSGLVWGYLDGLAHMGERRAVSLKGYRLHRQIRRAHAVPFAEIESSLARQL